MSDMKATVVGAGSWGTVLAMVLAETGHDVSLWSFEADVASSINERSENPYLQGVTLPRTIRAETDLAAAVRGAKLVASEVRRPRSHSNPGSWISILMDSTTSRRTVESSYLTGRVHTARESRRSREATSRLHQRPRWDSPRGPRMAGPSPP